MRPGRIAKALQRRRNYLVAKLEANVLRENQRTWVEEEVSALNAVLQMVEPMSGGLDPQRREERMQGARRAVARQAATCTCERCPVHRGESHG